MKNIKAFIFARAGSKGLPNKNLLLLEGISLIERSLKIASSIKEIDQVFLSTDIVNLDDINHIYKMK